MHLLDAYIDLHTLFQKDIASREENRAFGLSHVTIKKKPIAQLLAWREAHKGVLKKPPSSERIASALYSITFGFILLAFLVGILTGVGLLSYNGHAPVNVVYFMAVAIVLPLLSMFLSLLAMLRARSKRSVLVHISPVFWIEKIVMLFPHQIQKEFEILRRDPSVANWILIKRAQWVALFFSLGLLVALVVVVVTKDVAFAWSTTLHISAKDFHQMLSWIALPWKAFAPEALPTLKLIELSQYFRLGDQLSHTMILHASELGEWWKFLGFATLFYALILRILVIFIASLGYRRALRKALLRMEGVGILLKEMNEPIITTHAMEYERPMVQDLGSETQSLSSLDTSYDVVQGWAMGKSELIVLCDAMQIIAPLHLEVGGTKSFAEDNEVISRSHGEVLLFVKAWEPPTMDVMDYLEDLSAKVDKIVVIPVGTEENAYATKPQEMAIWQRKLIAEDNPKIWLKQ